MKHLNLFKGRTAVFVTKHKKESVVFPTFSNSDIKMKLVDSIDTDLFGTFTGEIPRSGTQVEAARLKALKAIEQTGETLAVASEGSFGPHPTLSFVPANVELVLLLDTHNQIELHGWEISTDTNYAHQKVNSVDEALNFSNKVGFPSHGLLVRPNSSSANVLFKGITNESELISAVTLCIMHSEDLAAMLQTDMRAMCNPKRMLVIESAARNLLEKMNSLCPACGWPGFDVTEKTSGLPCDLCGSPTRSTLRHHYTCKKCSFNSEVEFPGGKTSEDPMYCDWCNP